MNLHTQTECLLILISAGADFSKWNVNGDSLLIRASYEGCVDLVNALLQEGADPNMLSQGGYSALYCACEKNHPEIVKLLLKNGADIEKGVQQGYVPLCIASRRGNTEVVDILIKKGADLTFVDEYFNTALMTAVENSHADIVELLLNANKKLADQRNDDGQTALMLAIDIYSITKFDTRIIEFFIEKCDVESLNLEDNYGVSALCKAHEYGLDEIVDLLIEAGAT